MTQADSTTSPVRDEQQHAQQPGGRLFLEWQRRREEYPYLAPIGEIAVSADNGLNAIAHLEALAKDKEGPIDLDYDPGMTWEELRAATAGWKWALGSILAALRGPFSHDVDEARFNAGCMSEKEEAAFRRVADKPFQGAQDEDDAQAALDIVHEPSAEVPTVAELPPARSKPYWLG
jgi:hypothetical protein